MAVVQSNYSVYQQKGYVGDVAYPGRETNFEIGVAGVPAAGASLQPGWGVVYTPTSNDWLLATSAATALTVTGIVSFNPAETQSGVLSAIPSGANSDSFVEYADEAVIKVGTVGAFWAKAGEALEYGDIVVFDYGGDKDWIKPATAITNYATQPKMAIYALSSAAVGELVILKLTGVFIK